MGVYRAGTPRGPIVAAPVIIAWSAVAAQENDAPNSNTGSLAMTAERLGELITNAVLSFGTSYSSGMFMFNGGDSAEIEQQRLIEELKKQKT